MPTVLIDPGSAASSVGCADLDLFLLIGSADAIFALCLPN
jgi:hypothetical protein